MKCAACGFEKPIINWIQVKSGSPDKNTVTPKISIYRQAGSSQYDQLYACPKCGTVRIRRVGDR